MVAIPDATLAGGAGFLLVMVTLMETTPSRKFWADAGVTKRAHSKAAAAARDFGILVMLMLSFRRCTAWHGPKPVRYLVLDCFDQTC
jgi:hypothetical protein